MAEYPTFVYVRRIPATGWYPLNQADGATIWLPWRVSHVPASGVIFQF
ncbi:MAG: hypothetical protein M9933_00800 [Chitinophagaceae bacterium]|nr:hypothetical protein [Chitinophagaceae bacterium]